MLSQKRRWPIALGKHLKQFNLIAAFFVNGLIALLFKSDEISMNSNLISKLLTHADSGTNVDRGSVDLLSVGVGESGGLMHNDGAFLEPPVHAVDAVLGGDDLLEESIGRDLGEGVGRIGPALAAVNADLFADKVVLRASAHLGEEGGENLGHIHAHRAGGTVLVGHASCNRNIEAQFLLSLGIFYLVRTLPAFKFNVCLFFFYHLLLRFSSLI